mgnify:CR=1 FL=1
MYQSAANQSSDLEFTGIERDMAPLTGSALQQRSAVGVDEEKRPMFLFAPGPKLANMLEEGITPILPPERLAELGYKIAAYPLTLLGCAVRAMQDALGHVPPEAVPAIAEHLAELRGLSPSELAVASSANARRVLRWPGATAKPS